MVSLAATGDATVCGTGGKVSGTGGGAAAARFGFVAVGVRSESDRRPGDGGGGTAVGGAVASGVGGKTDGEVTPEGDIMPRNDGVVECGLPVAGGVVTIGGGISALSRRPSVGSLNVDARFERNEPMPAPHDEIAARAGAGGDVSMVEWRASRRGRAVGGGGASSTSAFVTSTGELVRFEDSLSDTESRCEFHRSRTPSTALKKFVEPAVRVRATASRAGASCCSSLRSWRPSCRRSPMSATTDGFSLHGWRGSTMSKSSGSVVRSQTSYAFVCLNSDIQNGLKSSVEFASPPSEVCQQTDSATSRGCAPDPPDIITPFPSPLAMKSRYRTDASAAEMYSSN